MSSPHRPSRSRRRARVSHPVRPLAASRTASCAAAVRVTAVLALALGACADEPGAAWSGRVLVQNAGPDTVAVIAVGGETAPLVDPHPGPVPVARFGGLVVPPARTGALPVDRVSGYRAGGDVRLFVYHVLLGQATLRTHVDARARELARPGFRVRVAEARAVSLPGG